MLIASTATVGLLLVGVLALSMTPDRLGAPDESFSSSTDIVLVPGPASGSGSTGDGGPQSIADGVARAVSTFLSATTEPLNPAAPANPADPIIAATSVLLPSTSDVATSPPDVALVPTDPPASTEPSTSTSGSSAAQPSNTESIGTADEPESTIQALAATGDESPRAADVTFGLTESSESALAEPGSSTSSPSSSTVPGQSTTSSSTTSTSSTSTTSTTAAETSTTFAPLTKQLAG